MKASQQGQRKQLFVGLSLGFIIMLAIVGCGLTPATAQPAAQIDVQLAWVHTIEYSGFYMAEEKGYYGAENLAVKLHELGDKAPVEAVVTGEADFGVTSADTLLLARASGAPVVAVAAIYQRSPVAFISLVESKITRPEDLVGKRVMVDFDGTTGVIYRAMLASQGIELTEVKSVPRTDFSNDPLVKGEVDVLDAYINNQPIQLAQEGHEVNVILASDYGIEMYADIIFTSEEMIAKQPELVKRFLGATTQGIQSAVDDPEGAAKLAVARNAELSLASETESINRALPLLNPAGSKPGMMTAKSWETAHQILLDQEILKEPLEVEAAYTLAFLEEIYANQTGSK